jgi:flagellar assembly protein FliH
MPSNVIRSPQIQDPAVLVGEEDAIDRSGEEGDEELGAEEEPDSEADDEEEVIEEPLPDPEEIIAEARAEAQVMIEQDRAAAVEEGRREGLEAAESETQEARNRLAALIDATETDYERALRQSEAQIVQLCMTIGERIARTSLAESADSLAGIIEEALSRAAEDIALTVRLHPEDDELISEHWDKILESRDGRGEVTKTIDDSIERGGSIIEADGGHIDATIASRVGAVAESLGPPPDQQENASTD